MKRLKRFGYVLLGFSLLWAVWTILQTYSRFNSKDLSKLKKGMTRQEVYAIIGKPRRAGNKSSDLWASFKDNLPPPWVANHTLIIIRYNENDQVEEIDLKIEKRSWKERLSINRSAFVGGFIGIL
jgi:hypothetical protein